jgi:response regulator NasT
MSLPQRIAVADDDAVMRLYFEKILPRLGHDVVALAANGRELVDQCRTCAPDLILTDIVMPELDGIAATALLWRETAIPVIVVSALDDPELASRAQANHILCCLCKPVKQADIAPVIGLALRRFEQFKTLYADTEDLARALEDRQYLERAKLLLKKQERVDEEQAFRCLQELASAGGLKLAEAARAVLNPSGT